MKNNIKFGLGKYYVSNEGTKLEPSFCVWIPRLNFSVLDSAYSDISLATERCTYLYLNHNREI